MRFALQAVFAALIAASGATAGSYVQFEGGRSMRVERVEQVDDVVHITLEGGGTLALPAHRIAFWAERSEPVVVVEDAGRADDADIPEEPWRVRAGAYAELIGLAAARYELDPALLTAMAEVESAFDPVAVSPKGACGLLQLMPQTAARFGVADVFDAEQNVEGGARYLSWLLERFEGNSELALAGYNAGEGAVERYRGIPPYQETRRYVARVLEGAGRLATLAP